LAGDGTVEALTGLVGLVLPTKWCRHMASKAIKHLAMLATVAAVLASLISPGVVYAAGDVTNPANISASVTVNAVAPTVSFAFYSDSGYTTTTTEFVPQTPVYMKIDVSTDNVLEEVEITVQMFADTNASAVGTPPPTTNPSTYVNFTIYYNATQGQWVLDADTGGSSTWSISFDPNQPLPDPSSTSGTFYIVIVPGKTAAEAMGGSTSDSAPYADWDVIVTATVAGTASNQASGYGYIMYFYGEVDTSTTSLDFGSLNPGATSSVLQLPVTVIANGYYDLKVVTTSTWTHTDGTHQITLTTSSPGLGQFRLNESLSYDSTTGTLTNPVSVTSNLTTTPTLVDDGNPTTESGQGYTIYLQLELGKGIYSGQYSGQITVYAVDGK